MRLTRLFRRRQWNDERARELQSYLDEEIADNLARGMTPAEARVAAHRKLGNATRIREEIYEMNSLGFVETLWQDLRYGVRLLRRNPTFAVVAILTLALGTGANTAIFQLVNAVRLRTLPVSHPEQLAEIRIVKAPHGRTGQFNGRWPMLSYPLYEKVRDEQQVFTDVVAWGSTTFDLSPGGEIRPAEALWVSGNFFPALGVRPAVGRLLSPGDDVKGCGAPGVVLGYPFWQREYGADPAAIGRTILLDGHRLDIIGVASPAFFGVDVGRAFDVAVPICARPIFMGDGGGLERSDVWFLAALGRLKPGVTTEQAGAHLARLSNRIQAATVSPRYGARDAKDYLDMQLGALPAAAGISGLRRNYGDSLNILLAVTALVLLIACANLANLMLARATAREREVAVRLAIGASRRRIVRQMLSESLLIAALGAAGGLLAAQWFSRFLVAFLSRGGGSPLFIELTLDWRVFAFTASVAVAACLIFGLTPAIRATAASPGVAMKAGGRGMTEGATRFGVRRALVVVQVAVSMVLVVGALLFTRTLLNLSGMDPGFRQDGVLTAAFDMRKAGMEPGVQAAFDGQLIERLRAIPGVTAVARAFTTPVGGNFWNERITIGGVLQKEPVNLNSVGPDYFGALDIPLVAGRNFDRRDTPDSPHVAIVSESFAKRYFPDTQAIGQAFQFEGEPGEPRPVFEIVGVVADTKYSDLREPFLPLVYEAARQEKEPGSEVRVVVRASTALPGVSAAVTRAVGELNPVIAIQYHTVRELVDDSLLRERLMATLSGFFGGLAVLIATIGLYGVMSYMVERRRVEIGIRMALGADRSSVMRLIVREAGILLAAGIAIGTLAAMFAARTAVAFLYGLTPHDPLTIATAAGALAIVAFGASWIPARRASRLAPTLALREE
jgi:putative ABC transport system permease protein